MSPEKYFTEQQKKEMVSAIKEAELNTSGEIRIHFDNHCKKNVLKCAATIFRQLGMDRTTLHNGVLIYIALEDKRMAIVGDSGINEKVPDDFWKSIKDRMIEKFCQGHITEGVCEAIRETGIQLKKFFPRQQDDKNELPDEISFQNSKA